MEYKVKNIYGTYAVPYQRPEMPAKLICVQDALHVRIWNRIVWATKDFLMLFSFALAVTIALHPQLFVGLIWAVFK